MFDWRLKYSRWFIELIKTHPIKGDFNFVQNCGFVILKYISLGIPVCLFNIFSTRSCEHLSLYIHSCSVNLYSVYLASFSTFEQQSNQLKSLSWKTDEDTINGGESDVEELEQSVKVNLLSKFKLEDHMHIQQTYWSTSQLFDYSYQLCKLMYINSTQQTFKKMFFNHFRMQMLLPTNQANH